VLGPSKRRAKSEKRGHGGESLDERSKLQKKLPDEEDRLCKSSVLQVGVAEAGASGEPSSRKRVIGGESAGALSRYNASEGLRDHSGPEEGSLSTKKQRSDTSPLDLGLAGAQIRDMEVEMGDGIGAGRSTEEGALMRQLLGKIKATSTNMQLPLIDNTSDHFDLMISYRDDTEKTTASRLYDKIMLARSQALTQIGNRRCKIPEYARADNHTGELDPGIARTFLDQKHISQGMQWEKVCVSAVANSLVLVPLLSWYEEDGNQPSGSVGELMLLHHCDKVDKFLLEIMIANMLMQLPAGHRWLQRISPIFIGEPDARGYTEFPLANIDKLPDVPSLKTCERAAEILMDDLKIPVDTTVMAFSVKKHINHILQFQGVKLSDLGQEDIALQSASKSLINQIPALQQSLSTEMQNVLVYEMQAAAGCISRNSPAPSEISGVSTVPQSPQSPESLRTPDVVAMHIDENVIEFRDEMERGHVGFLWFVRTAQKMATL